MSWVAREVAQRWPELALQETEVATASIAGRSGRGLRARLAEHADRVTGARAVGARRTPLGAAHRVFFRHVGLDPDVTPPPLEAALRERLVHGGFPSRGPLADALLVALLDTGVGVWAAGAAALRGPLGIDVRDDRLIVADDAGHAVAELFGAVDAAFAATRAPLRLFAIAVPGVPSIAAAEALHICVDALAAGG